ncbi:hypothetical protein PF007_g31907 [Phytophthora fragariae]|uniref:Uncharacterized protein n=1 Tax=Phytophthora fragariae TaxID=53985 RepID=A0A6A3PRB3_9STRA|nr:hypothetical protein PF007_g31907 [Phytophthora fragariae]
MLLPPRSRRAAAKSAFVSSGIMRCWTTCQSAMALSGRSPYRRSNDDFGLDHVRSLSRNLRPSWTHQRAGLSCNLLPRM